jgi:hypothetical protein
MPSSLEMRMKHILDSSFRYKPSFDTDVRKTFDRIRRQQQQPKARDAATENREIREIRVKVLQLDQLKKANGS